MASATAFIIVPPRTCPSDATFLKNLEAALRSALPNYDFTVTIDHVQREDKNFVVAPNGTPDIPTMSKLYPILERFSGAQPTSLH